MSKILIDKATVKLALEALEINNKAWKALADSGDAGFWEAEEQPFYELSVKAITALLEALAEQPAQQEPVEVCEYCKRGLKTMCLCEFQQPAQQRTEELLEIFKDVDQTGPLLGMGGKKIGCVNHDCDQCKEQPAQQEPVACKTLCELCVKRGYIFCANAAQTTPIPSPPAQQDIQRLSALVRAQQITIDKLEAQRT